MWSRGSILPTSTMLRIRCSSRSRAIDGVRSSHRRTAATIDSTSGYRENMKPFSLLSEDDGAGLFAPVFSRGPVAREVSDSAFLQAMLDTEAGLARALARANLTRAESAQAVTAAARANFFDIDELSRASAEAGNPVPALVHALIRAVPNEAAAA